MQLQFVYFLLYRFNNTCPIKKEIYVLGTCVYVAVLSAAKSDRFICSGRDLIKYVFIDAMEWQIRNGEVRCVNRRI